MLLHDTPIPVRRILCRDFGPGPEESEKRTDRLVLTCPDIRVITGEYLMR